MKNSLSVMFRGFLLVLAVICCFDSRAMAEEKMSARMHSLGGRPVAGIIPDYYTDLMINPAFAAETDSMTLQYCFRNSVDSKTPLLRIDRDFNFGEIDFQSQSWSNFYTSGFDIYGISFLGWKAAVSSQWRLANEEEVDPQYDYSESVVSSSYYRMRYRCRMENNKEEFWRLSVAAARDIGDKSSIGFRLGILGRYYLDQTRYLWHDERYQKEDQVYELYYRSIDDDSDPEIQRLRSYYLELGLKTGDREGAFSEVVIDISRDSHSMDFKNWYISTQREYDDYGYDNYLLRYYYDGTEYGNINSGDLYSFGIKGRRRFPEGLTLFAGLNYESCRYDARWYTSDIRYRWYAGSSSENESQDNSFSGTGDFKGTGGFLKLGKEFPIGGKLSITTSIAAFAGLTDNDLSPRMITSYYYEGYSDTTSLLMEQEHSLSIEIRQAEIFLPFSLEFKPASYFSLFGSVRPYLRWKERRKRFALPELGANVEPYREIYTLESSETEWESGYYADIGFSLNYRGRLFLDVYSGSDLTPDNLSSMILDLRYLF